MDHIQDLEPRCSKHWQRPGAPHWGNGLPGGLFLLALTTLLLHPGARGPGQHGSEVHSARRADDRRGDTGPAMPQGRGYPDSHSQSSPTLSDLPDPGLAPRPADSPSGQAGGPQEVSAPSSSSGDHSRWLKVALPRLDRQTSLPLHTRLRQQIQAGWQPLEVLGHFRSGWALEEDLLALRWQDRPHGKTSTGQAVLRNGTPRLQVRPHCLRPRRPWTSWAVGSKAGCREAQGAPRAPRA